MFKRKKQHRIRVNRTFTLHPDVMELIELKARENNTNVCRALDLIVQEWLEDRLVETQNRTKDINTLENIVGLIQTVDARLSWIEGILADAELIIDKTEDD